MKIREFYQYSWFANLSYVLWSDESWNPTWNPDKAIRDANGAKRVPGNTTTPGTTDTLGEKIFVQDKWQIAHYTPDDGAGFSATFFAKGNTNEKVLAIRGTNATDSAGQFILDLLTADLGQIGVIGMALTSAGGQEIFSTAT